MRLRRAIAALRGWKLFLAALAAIAATAWFDEQTVRLAPLHGFAPDDAYAMLSCAEFPRAWREVMAGDVFQRIEADWPAPMAPLDLAVRHATGVRPTPLRWRVWLGNRAVIGWSPDGAGVCAYPGLLLRGVEWTRRAVGIRPDADGISRYRALHFAWRSGFVIASPSRDYVRACLKSRRAHPLKCRAQGELTLQWTGPHEGYLRLLPGPGAPVEGQIRLALSDGQRPLTLPSAWSGSPIAAVTARGAPDLRVIASAVDKYLVGLPHWLQLKGAVRILIRHWGIAPLPEGWDAGIDQASFAILDVSTGSTLPIPNLALVLRGSAERDRPHPLLDLFPNQPRIPYVWGGEPGCLVPIVGEECSAYLGQSGRDWIITNQEPTMAALAGSLAAGPALTQETDVTLRVDWRRTGEVFEALLLKAAELELIPRMNETEARSDVPPKTKALSNLGTLSLDGFVRKDTVLFKGHLFRSP